jgi:competence protein ComEA
VSVAAVLGETNALRRNQEMTMLKMTRLPLSLLALTVAAPVFAAEPPATAPAPSHSTAAPAKPANTTAATTAPKSAAVDINNASAADLKALPGMTDAEAAKIVQGRPYKDPSDLVSKKIMSDSEFAKVKDRLVAGHTKS